MNGSCLFLWPSDLPALHEIHTQEMKKSTAIVVGALLVFVSFASGLMLNPNFAETVTDSEASTGHPAVDATDESPAEKSDADKSPEELEVELEMMFQRAISMGVEQRVLVKGMSENQMKFVVRENEAVSLLRDKAVYTQDFAEEFGETGLHFEQIGGVKVYHVVVNARQKAMYENRDAVFDGTFEYVFEDPKDNLGGFVVFNAFDQIIQLPGNWKHAGNDELEKLIDDFEVKMAVLSVLRIEIP